MPPTVVVARRAPYKDFLQPALQRRFAYTVLLLLGIAYFEALTWSSWNSFIWSWFPIGLPGLRTLAILGCILPTIILRIAHSHIGIRTSNSPLETLFRTLFLFSTAETILTYAVSAWLFSQTYLFSLPYEARLHWIIHHNGDRIRLNERALFYTTNLVVLGIVQGVLHLALDYDRMLLGTVKPKSVVATNPPVPDTFSYRLGEWSPAIILRSAGVSITVGLVNYGFLYHFIRPTAWAWAMTIFRRFYNLPRSNIPPSGAPWSISMLSRSIWAGFLLCLLWYFGDIAFRLQLGKPPLKNGQPLTSESKDPNGSLLNGLKSKKARVSAFAMWELALIARDFEIRRKAIFEDIDRKDGPMWSQIYVICLGTVKKIEQTIDNYGKPPAPPNPEAVPPPPQPRERLVQPPKAGDVFVPPPTPTGLRPLGSPGKSPAESLVPGMRKKAVEMADHLMTKQQQEAFRPETISGLFQTLSVNVLRTPFVGPFFQQVFSRRLTKAVFGTPYADVSVYVNAAYSLSRLSVCSLTEDIYGNVQRDVPSIIRTFTMVIKKLEKFRDEFPVHWTDLSGSRESEEVNELLDALKDGLGELIAAFGQYSSDLRLTRADMRLAREAAEKRATPGVDAAGAVVVRQPEMRQLG
ncbi:nucleoporin protein Ndc1-Nup [Biscogniauxia mediterranea]|nr:nucleoporin protein Ndc1-Nup [Biscogniauxia mediterranea]